MKKENVLSALQEIFRDILNNELILLSEETNSNDVEGWDSLTNIMLVVTIENHFGIKFLSSEILGWKSVSDMCDSILMKL
ncbi:acyl carrier protein [Schleiferiaceae bacterium]|nr:acyl carrier protein [Schleiferiaceae bacterium]